MVRATAPAANLLFTYLREVPGGTFSTRIMRATKISLAVFAAIAMGSTPGSSLDVPRAAARHDPLVCPNKSAISLVSAQGIGIALVSSQRCAN